MSDKQIPTPGDLFLSMPLYEARSFDEEKHGSEARDIKYFQGTIDSYCPWCQRDSVFENKSKKMEYDTFESTRPQIYAVSLICSRNKEHELFFVIKIHEQTIQKIGQYPSTADLQLQDLKKYAKVLGPEQYKEFTKAVGLSSHGVGVGSFVYLRRIFENLVEEAHIIAVAEEGFDEDAYQKGRISEKITILKGHLPEFLVTHPKLYSILSKGIHELSENDCLKHFPVVKVGIEIILDDKIEEIRKMKKLKDASRAISNAGLEVDQ